jgi:hypothetical protein
VANYDGLVAAAAQWEEARAAAAATRQAIGHGEDCPVCALRDRVTLAWGAPYTFTLTGDPMAPLATDLVPSPEQKAANERAAALLDAHLTGEQRACKEKSSYIPVTGSAGGSYRIYLYRIYNIRRVDGGTETHRVCAGPGGNLPLDDYLLAQMLALRSDEHGFLARANVATKTGGFIGHGPVWEREQERGLWRYRLDELERERTALHHLDGNPRNNVPANLAWVVVNRAR